MTEIYTLQSPPCPLLNCVWLFVTPWTAARQDSLSITNSQSLLKLMFIELVMPSNHPFLLLPSVFPSIRVFSNESALHIRWPKYWSFSFSISPSSEYSGLISFRIDWFDLLAVQRTLKNLLQHHSLKAAILQLCCTHQIFSPFFPTIPLERTPQTIARISKYRAKPEDTTPIALSFIWIISVEKWVYALVCHGLICVRRRYSKCYPSPTKSPLSLQHLSSCRGGEHLLVWLLEFTCLSAKTYIRLPPKWVGSSDACVSTPHCRELRKLRADSAEGKPSAVFLRCPS